MVTFNNHTTLVVWIFFLTKLNGRQRDKFFQSHGTLRVNFHEEIFCWVLTHFCWIFIQPLNDKTPCVLTPEFFYNQGLRFPKFPWFYCIFLWKNRMFPVSFTHFGLAAKPKFLLKFTKKYLLQLLKYFINNCATTTTSWFTPVVGFHSHSSS